MYKRNKRDFLLYSRLCLTKTNSDLPKSEPFGVFCVNYWGNWLTQDAWDGYDGSYHLSRGVLRVKLPRDLKYYWNMARQTGQVI